MPDPPGIVMGWMEALSPTEGKVARSTGLENPSIGATAIVAVPNAPGLMSMEVGLADRAKSGPCTITEMMTSCINSPPLTALLPVTSTEY